MDPSLRARRRMGGARRWSLLLSSRALGGSVAHRGRFGRTLFDGFLALD